MGSNVDKQFGGVVFPMNECALFRREETRSITCVDGQVRPVTMSHWHWWVFTWIVRTVGHPLDEIMEAIERLRGRDSYSQTLKWWLECYHEARCQLEDEDRVTSS